MQLREVVQEDIEIFFEYMQDADQQWQAAFVAKDPSNRQAHFEHWKKTLNTEGIINRTIVLDDQVIGSIGRWMMDGVPQLTYWLGKKFTGLGYATAAVKLFLELDQLRPIEARCAFDNHASVRVLEKNGFRFVGGDLYFSNARGQEITELIFRLT